MRELSNVRLVSNGIPSGTYVEVDGVKIDGIIGLSWQMKSHAHIGELTLIIEGVDVEVLAERLDLVDAAADGVGQD